MDVVHFISDCASASQNIVDVNIKNQLLIIILLCKQMYIVHDANDLQNNLGTNLFFNLKTLSLCFSLLVFTRCV